MLSINRGIRLDSVEYVEAGEKIDSSDGQQILRLSVSRRKEMGDVAQLVRALPCHGRGRGFEPRRPRHTFQKDLGVFGGNQGGCKRTQICAPFVSFL
jgi:hypothetical protein